MERRRGTVAAEQAMQLVAGQVLAAAQDSRPADGQSELESYE